jgi:CBS domain-containing protein
MKASQVMESEVLTVGPETSVSDVARALLSRRISAVPVVENGKLVGIVSEGDLIRRVETGTERHRSWWLEHLTTSEKLATEYVKSHARLAGEIMTRDVITAGEDASLAEIAKLFEDNSIKRVPIMRGGKIVGIVSRADLLRVLADLHEKSDPISADDTAIREEIMKRLKAEHWFASAQMEISVRNGAVKLEGIAMSPEQQMAMRVAAENVPGVRSVNDVAVLRRYVVE